LPELAAEHHMVLDVGCAGGGFFEIFRHFRPDIRYIGADFSHALTGKAIALHPAAQFIVADSAQGLPFGDAAIPYVQALGWLHWEPRYVEALRELWRVTSRHLFFDIRISKTGQPTLRGEQRVAYNEPWDGTTTTPYIAVEWRAFADLISALNPASVRIKGYWGRPANTVTGLDGELCFATFVLEKRSSLDRGNDAPVTIDAPLSWPLERGWTVTAK
jgi:trans-aconitate methyltransferase